jgi:hypothetical protein
MSAITQYIKDHHSAILATVVLLQNFTPFGKELRALLETIGAVFSTVGN